MRGVHGALGRQARPGVSDVAAGMREAVTTIEGLAAVDGTLHPMQEAFIQEDAFQCGYCTPGQILSAVACVREKHADSENEIREYMSGNICRCAAYPNIVKAIARAKFRTEA
jgi:xanthine dehydrogenase YagT iron-sulfur-binding subunit